MLAVSRRGFDLLLEAVPEQQHQVGRLNVGDTSGRELEIVRLGSGWGQVLDRDVSPADLLRRVSERIERGHYSRPAAVRGGRARPAPGGKQGQAQQDENDSRSH